ncbi:MAG: hypothetical protein JOS17DRAFT_792796 [Linnemannia elongata]|nr:MAG: hypothetical protein JOS17DRAFT_792796 [Linnemannia elongata]
MQQPSLNPCQSCRNKSNSSPAGTSSSIIWLPHLTAKSNGPLLLASSETGQKTAGNESEALVEAATTTIGGAHSLIDRICSSRSPAKTTPSTSHFQTPDNKILSSDPSSSSANCPSNNTAIVLSPTTLSAPSTSSSTSSSPPCSSSSASSTSSSTSGPSSRSLPSTPSSSSSVPPFELSSSDQSTQSGVIGQESGEQSFPGSTAAPASSISASASSTAADCERTVALARTFAPSKLCRLSESSQQQSKSAPSIHPSSQSSPLSTATCDISVYI